MIVAIIAAAIVAHLPAPIFGDFRHDGHRERAEVIRRPKGGYSLVVSREGQGGGRADVIFSMKSARDFYVDRAKPGHYRTACGKGYGPDQDHCTLEAVDLKGDTLDFGFSESSEAVAMWTGRRFEVVWISD